MTFVHIPTVWTRLQVVGVVPALEAFTAVAIGTLGNTCCLAAAFPFLLLACIVGTDVFAAMLLREDKVVLAFDDGRLKENTAPRKE